MSEQVERDAEAFARAVTDSMNPLKPEPWGSVQADDLAARARIRAEQDAWDARWWPVFDALYLGTVAVVVCLAVIGLAFLVRTP